MTRMTLANAPEPATIDDARAVSRTLASAFGDDPMMQWFFPDETSREADLGRYFTTLFTRQYGLHGVCERTASAAAFWVSPEGADKAVPDAEPSRNSWRSSATAPRPSGRPSWRPPSTGRPNPTGTSPS